MNRIDMAKHKAFAEADVQANWFVIFRNRHGRRIAGIAEREGYLRALVRAAAMNEEQRVFRGPMEPIFQGSSIPPTTPLLTPASAPEAGAP